MAPNNVDNYRRLQELAAPLATNPSRILVLRPGSELPYRRHSARSRFRKQVVQLQYPGRRRSFHSWHSGPIQKQTLVTRHLAASMTDCETQLLTGDVYVAIHPEPEPYRRERE